MCPACVASAALVAGSITTTGGLTALFVRFFRSRTNSQSPGANIANPTEANHAKEKTSCQ